MPNVIKCPECQKALKVGDAVAGKRVRCPACKNTFVAPAVAAPELEEVPEPPASADSSEVQAERPARRRRDPDEDDEEDEEEDRPRRRRRSRGRRGFDARQDYVPSNTPLVLAILACTCSCAPLIGFGLGYYAMYQANAELDRIPGGKSYQSARTKAQLAKTIGIVGMCLSGVMFVVAIALRVLGPD